jgi:hypothetical protein
MARSNPFDDAWLAQHTAAMTGEQARRQAQLTPIVGRARESQTICQRPAPIEIAGNLVLPVTLILSPLRTQTEKNTGGHWAGKSRRAKTQRSLTYHWLVHWFGMSCPFTLPLTITLTRVAPGTLDAEDNLTSAVSHIRDGVADYLEGTPGKGEDRREGLEWSYTQTRSKPGRYAVHITLEKPC